MLQVPPLPDSSAPWRASEDCLAGLVCSGLVWFVLVWFGLVCSGLEKTHSLPFSFFSILTNMGIGELLIFIVPRQNTSVAQFNWHISCPAFFVTVLWTWTRKWTNIEAQLVLSPLPGALYVVHRSGTTYTNLIKMFSHGFNIHHKTLQINLSIFCIIGIMYMKKWMPHCGVKSCWRSYQTI